MITPSIPPKKTTFDAAIFGAGLAGLSTAVSLLDRGLSVIVLDNKAVGGGASGALAGMVNPATGRRATKAWMVEHSYPAVKRLLEKAQSYADTSLYKQTGVLRPAQNEEMHEQMWEQYQKTDWPEGWVEWLSADAIKQKHPGIHCVNGGLWIPVGLMVRMPQYLKALHRLIADHPQGNLYVDPELERSYVNGQWIIKSSLLPEKLNPGIVIDTKGFGTVRSRDWSWLPLHPVKGQLARFFSTKPLSFTHSISSLGYMARYNDHQLMVGSTYEHHFSDTEPTEDAGPKLFEKLERTLPEIAHQFQLQQLWSGVRISTPNHKPIIGAHPKHPSLYVFVGLSSKGLLYSKYGGDLLAEHILNQTEITAKFSIDRLPQKPSDAQNRN